MVTRVTVRPFSVSGAATRRFRLFDERPLAAPVLALLTAFSYYFGSQIGFFLTPQGSPISVFWPPNAILLSIFLLTPERIWWLLIAAVCPAHFLIQINTGVPLLSAFGWLLGNVGEALLGATCIRHFQKEKELLFTSVRGVVTFLAFGAFLAPLATSFLDAGSTVLTGLGGSYWNLWAGRFASNLLANLTIVPAIVTFATSGIRWLREARRAQYFEAAQLTVATVGVSLLVFAQGNLFEQGPVFICAPLPLLVWAALRFGPTGLSFTMLEVTLISVWSALQGRGIFAQSSLPARVVSVHILLGLYVLPFLLMAAVIAERQRKEERLEKTRGKLIDAQEQECQRIARELHTDIAGRLTLAGLSIDELQTDFSASEKLNGSGLYRTGNKHKALCGRCAAQYSHRDFSPAVSRCAAGLAGYARSSGQNGERAAQSRRRTNPLADVG